MSNSSEIMEFVNMRLPDRDRYTMRLALEDVFGKNKIVTLSMVDRRIDYISTCYESRARKQTSDAGSSKVVP